MQLTTWLPDCLCSTMHMFRFCQVTLVARKWHAHRAALQSMRTASHWSLNPASALLAQGVASAPLWDEEQGAIIGMISASDFIHILRRLRSRCPANWRPQAFCAHACSTYSVAIHVRQRLPMRIPICIVGVMQCL